MISVSGDGEANEVKPPPMMTTIQINGVPAKSLIDTGLSGDFIKSHEKSLQHPKYHYDGEDVYSFNISLIITVATWLL